MNDYDDLLHMAGMKELEMCENLKEALKYLKTTDTARGRLWAIAATDAEKLCAWISYALATGAEDA